MNRNNIWHLSGCIIMFAFLAFAVLPMVWTLMISFRPQFAIFSSLWETPTKWTIENLVSVFHSSFSWGLLNSFIASTGSIALAMIVGIPASFALAKGGFKKSFAMPWAILLLRMAPPVGIGLPLYLIYRYTGLLDTYIGLIFAYMSIVLPFVIWSLWNTFSLIPDAIIEAAILDGANIRQTLLKVVIPFSKSGIIATGILGFMLSWNDFFFALTLTRDKTKTAPVAIMDFISYGSVNWGEIAMACIILTLPLIPVILFSYKYIVQSMGGGVKG